MEKIIFEVLKAYTAGCVSFCIFSTAMAAGPEKLDFKDNYMGGTACYVGALPEVQLTQKGNEATLNIKYVELPVHGVLVREHDRARWARCIVDLQMTLPKGKKLVVTEIKTTSKVSALEPTQKAGARTYVGLDAYEWKNEALAEGIEQEEIISDSTVGRLESYCRNDELSKHRALGLRITSDASIERSRSKKSKAFTSLVSAELKMKIEDCEGNKTK